MHIIKSVSHLTTMELEQAKNLESRFLPNIFDRLPLIVEKGEGVYLFDVAGKRYLDLFSGVAVSSVGHGHPRLVNAVCEQAKKIIHMSNWVYSESQLSLAKRLCDLSGMERAFFSNDGTGAVEAALKLSKISTGRKEIVAMEGAFHGRTMGSLSATWDERYRKPFEPLLPGFSFCPYDDSKKLESMVCEETAAVIVEPILGEAGAIVPSRGFLSQVRRITEEAGALMIVDEIQTGFGRSGAMFQCIEQGIEPDIITCAKGLGGGFPIGAIMYRGMDFEPGQHGGTYNGSPLACACAHAVLDIIEDEGLVENSKKLGERIIGGLGGHKIHGMGLMLGIDTSDARKKALSLMDSGLIPIYCGDTLRILPPLVLKKSHADIIIDSLLKVL